jgi:hypothetical protein
VRRIDTIFTNQTIQTNLTINEVEIKVEIKVKVEVKVEKGFTLYFVDSSCVASTQF